MKHPVFKKTISALTLSVIASSGYAADQQDEKIKQLEQRIIELEQNLETIADAVEEEQTQTSSNTKKVHIGGYGEMHYNALSNDDEDIREIDFHRMVLFFGYEFNDHMRFVSEVEIEHSIASSGSRGAVELEQAYLEFDLKRNLHLKTGLLLMPLGIISETHEPPTFYGVERPIIETTIIPTTWFSAGASLVQNLDNGISYTLMVSEGLKTDDPNSDANADPFDIKSGKQKGSFASAYDLAMTGRVNYRGIEGLELSVYGQYQPDLDQSAEVSYADSATLLGGHAVYQRGDFTGKALYARWDLAGDAAEAAGKHIQDGGYLELSWRPIEQLGAFVRSSAWSQEEDVDATQVKIGLNYYPHPNIVFKVDLQSQNDEAGGYDGANLGVGYQF